MSGLVSDAAFHLLMTRLAEEAGHITAGLAVLERRAADAVLHDKPIDGAWLQQVDLSRQEAAGLATVLTYLADPCAGEAPFDPAHALAGLKLQAQRQRLSAS